MTKDDKRDRILDKAQEALARFGLRKMTMDDVATNCGLRKASLYYYFKSKEEMVAAIIRRLGQRLSGAVEERVETAATAAEAFRAYFELDPQRREDVRLIMGVLTEDFFEFLSLAEDAMRDVEDSHRDMLAGIIERGIQKGEFREVDAHTTAMRIHRAVRSLHAMSLLEKKDLQEEAQSTIKGLAELVLAGLLCKAETAA